VFTKAFKFIICTYNYVKMIYVRLNFKVLKPEKLSIVVLWVIRQCIDGCQLIGRTYRKTPVDLIQRIAADM
jgi:hypothetical protein